MASFHVLTDSTSDIPAEVRQQYGINYFPMEFSSDDGKIEGPNFHEYALIRLDGENWDSADYATNCVKVNKLDDSYDWDTWKRKNKEGMDCSVTLKRKGNTITFDSTNLGIDVNNVTTLKEDPEHIYIALTGDQCALTNIRIKDA